MKSTRMVTYGDISSRTLSKGREEETWVGELREGGPRKGILREWLEEGPRGGQLEKNYWQEKYVQRGQCWGWKWGGRDGRGGGGRGELKGGRAVRRKSDGREVKGKRAKERRSSFCGGWGDPILLRGWPLRGALHTEGKKTEGVTAEREKRMGREALGWVEENWEQRGGNPDISTTPL